MYQVNDTIIYGKMGACRVMDVTTPKGVGHVRNQLYYVLKALQGGCMIYAPVDTSVFMRPTISAAQAERLIDMIPAMREQPLDDESDRDRERYYSEVLANHDCRDLVRLTMALYAKKQDLEQQKRKLGQIDLKTMRQAEEMLFGEIALALDMPVDQVADYIAARVEAQSEPEEQVI